MVINTLGRRKTAVARVYITPGTGEIKVNNRDYTVYFPQETLQIAVRKSFETTNTWGQFDVKANVAGGGISGQADAIQLAIARALVEMDPEMKPALRKEGLMTRDPRMVERKKFGRRKARRRFQFSKR
jgi:small subunit ribosomal protein S9